MIKNRDKGCLLGVIKINIEEGFRKIRDMGTGKCIGLMEVIIKDSGKKECKMERL